MLDEAGTTQEQASTSYSFRHLKVGSACLNFYEVPLLCIIMRYCIKYAWMNIIVTRKVSFAFAQFNFLNKEVEVCV